MARNTDKQYAALMTGKPVWDYHLSDQKPAKRVKANPDEWVKIRARKLDGWPCRICDTLTARSLHHIVPKSLGGDDVAENCTPLCGTGTTGCHGLVEARDPWACTMLGRRLTGAERVYVLGKKGAAFLERYYGVKEAA
jgi:hypothetical protein